MNSKKSNKEPAVIIGAGPAGLTAAYELSKLGMKSVVLEADTQVGGLARTVNYRGYRFDIGGHRFFSKVPYVNELWHEILGKDFVLRSRLSRIHYHGHFFDYPLKPLNALSGLGPLESLLVCLSYAKAKLSNNRKDDNFEKWVCNRFGYRLFKIFFKTYTEKVWGIPCSEISADWAAQRINNLSLRKAVLNALSSAGKTNNGEIITTLIEQFHYPQLGPGMMWERCSELLAAQGNPTNYNSRVERIHHRNGHVHCVYSNNSNNEQTELGAEHFVSTMPLKHLLFALDPPPPSEILQAADRLRYRDYLTVVLVVNREEVFRDNWIYIHTPDVKMGRIQNYKNWSKYMVPDQSKTTLGLEYFLWQHDEEWNWSDERLIEFGIHECSQLGIIEPDEVDDGKVVRMKKAYPVYDRNYHDSVAIIRQYLKTFDNLQTIGRNGLHRYNNQDHSMMTGVYAARNILGDNYDVWSVNTEKEYHEEKEAKGSLPGDRLIPTVVSPDKPEPQAVSINAVEKIFARVDPLALGIAVGVVCGLTIFLTTIISLLQAKPAHDLNLSLLNNYILGFEVSWGGAFFGFFEGGVGGFIVGNIAAWLRNLGMSIFTSAIRNQAETVENRDLLETL